MAVQSTADIIAELKVATERMREVRSAALTLRSIRQGEEPNPTPLPIDLTQPGAGFSGEPIRSNPTTA